MVTKAEYEARRDAVASRMTANPERFDMSLFWRETSCGTTYCIAGWALVEKLGENWIHASNCWPSVHAEIFLGIPEGYASGNRGLFYDFSLKTAEDAALALKSAPYVDCKEN